MSEDGNNSLYVFTDRTLDQFLHDFTGNRVKDWHGMMHSFDNVRQEYRMSSYRLKPLNGSDKIITVLDDDVNIADPIRKKNHDVKLSVPVSDNLQYTEFSEKTYDFYDIADSGVHFRINNLSVKPDEAKDDQPSRNIYSMYVSTWGAMAAKRCQELTKLIERIGKKVDYDPSNQHAETMASVNYYFTQDPSLFISAPKAPPASTDNEHMDPSPESVRYTGDDAILQTALELKVMETPSNSLQISHNGITSIERLFFDLYELQKLEGHVDLQTLSAHIHATDLSTMPSDLEMLVKKGYVQKKTVEQDTHYRVVRTLSRKTENLYQLLKAKEHFDNNPPVLSQDTKIDVKSDPAVTDQKDTNMPKLNLTFFTTEDNQTPAESQKEKKKPKKKQKPVSASKPETARSEVVESKPTVVEVEVVNLPPVDDVQVTPVPDISPVETVEPAIETAEKAIVQSSPLPVVEESKVEEKPHSTMRTRFMMNLTENQAAPLFLIENGYSDSVEVTQFVGPVQIHKGPDYVAYGETVSIQTITFKETDAKIHIQKKDETAQIMFNEPADKPAGTVYDNIKSVLTRPAVDMQPVDPDNQDGSIEQHHAKVNQTLKLAEEQMRIFEAFRPVFAGFHNTP